VLETAFGIPAHPLLIHIPVILVPLLILSVIVFGFVPRLRNRLDWAVAGLGVVAPISCVLARQSGIAFFGRLEREKAVSTEDVSKINTHESFGTRTMIIAIVLGVVALALVAVHLQRTRAAASAGTSSGSGHTVVTLALSVVGLAVGIAAGYYVFKTGDTGAHIVWQGR
jgi:hypothetical protein